MLLFTRPFPTVLPCPPFKLWWWQVQPVLPWEIILAIRLCIFAAWKNKYAESFAIVQFLLDFYPQSAKVLHKHGNTPLHHATNYKAHADIVQLLYRAYPKAVHIPNDKGQTPLDMAIHRLGEKHVVVAMLQGDSRNFVYQHSRLSRSELATSRKTSHSKGESKVETMTTPRTASFILGLHITIPLRKKVALKFKQTYEMRWIYRNKPFSINK